MAIFILRAGERKFGTVFGMGTVGEKRVETARSKGQLFRAVQAEPG